MRDLDTLRKELDSIDKELLELFIKRQDISKEVAISKASINKPIYDPVREAAKLESLNAMCDRKEYREYVQEFFKGIMDLSKKVQHDTDTH